MAKLSLHLFRRRKRPPLYSGRKYRLRRNAGTIVRQITCAGALLLVVMLLAGSLIALFNAVVSAPVFRIKQIVVRGCRELTEKDILALAQVNPSCTLLSINTGAIQRRLMASPWIRQAIIGREFPDRLILQIQERKPVALIQRTDGLWLLDMEGTPFKKLDNGDEADVPVLTGCNGPPYASCLLPEALELLQRAEACGMFLPGSIAEIHGDETFGLFLFTSNGLCLRFGLKCYENKLKRLVPVLADLEHRNLKGGCLQIDLEDPTKITIERRNIKVPILYGDARQTRTL